jgi:hypothetical protein
VNRHRLDADTDPDPNFHSDFDTDLDLDHTTGFTPEFFFSPFFHSNANLSRQPHNFKYFGQYIEIFWEKYILALLLVEVNTVP